MMEMKIGDIGACLNIYIFCNDKNNTISCYIEKQMQLTLVVEHAFE